MPVFNPWTRLLMLCVLTFCNLVWKRVPANCVKVCLWRSHWGIRWNPLVHAIYILYSTKCQLNPVGEIYPMPLKPEKRSTWNKRQHEANGTPGGSHRDQKPAGWRLYLVRKVMGHVLCIILVFPSLVLGILQMVYIFAPSQFLTNLNQAIKANIYL